MNVSKTDVEKKAEKSVYDSAYRKKNKEKIILRGKEYYESYRRKHFLENPRKYLFNTAKSRAKQFSVEFSIVEEDIVIPQFCPILGYELAKGAGYVPNAMSLDRVDNTKGYIKGNVRVISRKANQLKSSINLEFAEKLIKYLKGEL